MPDTPIETVTRAQQAGTERQASAWQGASNRAYPETCLPAAQTDWILNAWLGRLTGRVSPAAVSNAYVDWLSHVPLAQSKQLALLQQAYASLQRWQHLAITQSSAPGAEGPDCIAPLAQDKRFADPAWRHWPFHLLSRGFLLNQQWWHRASTGVRGVSQHHEDVATFTMRQWLDILAPSNFPWTNPVVLDASLASCGANLVRGLGFAAADCRASATPHAPRPSRFKAGESLALTPGKVVLRYLVDQGHTVFMISWKNPLAAGRDLSIEDYRQLGVMDALTAITSSTGAAQAAAAGYCFGGSLLAIAAARVARDGDHRLASVTLLASQVDFKEPGELSLFIDESQVSFLEAAMWYQVYLDTRQMPGAFQLLRSNDLIWSRRLHHYLLGLAEQDTDLQAWNADTTRIPYRTHSAYLRQLFLHNDQAEGRYIRGGRPIVLSDIAVPLFAVGTLSDHVAPWRSAFKLHMLADADVTFLLTSGGHNAGVVAPPGLPARSYQVAEHARDTTYLDRTSWQQMAPRREGSWWPAWEAWLAERGGRWIAPPAMGAPLGEAPGRYVMVT